MKKLNTIIHEINIIQTIRDLKFTIKIKKRII